MAIHRAFLIVACCVGVKATSWKGAADSPSRAFATILLAHKPTLGRTHSKTAAVHKRSIGRRAALFAPAALAPFLGPFPASAGGRVQIGGKYTDPMHPGCTRTVKIRGSDAIINGFDDIGGPLWEVKAKVGDNNGLIVDFTPKGGPTGVVAEWTGSGLKFPDGNVWGQISTADRVATNSMLADRYFDTKLLGSEYKFIQKEGQITLAASDGIGAEKKWGASGAAIGTEIFLDLSSRGEKGIVKGTRNSADGSITFDNGLSWKVQSVFSGGAR